MLVPCACTALLDLMLPGCADSPMYLLQNHGERRAAEALAWFRARTADGQIWSELSAMQLELSLSSSETLTIGDVARDRRLWGPILVGCGVNLSMQLSGIDAVLYYSTKVLEDAGVALEWAQLYTVLISLLNLLVTIPAMMLMDKAGRKVIQSMGLGGMCLSYVAMTAALVSGRHILA